MSRRFPNTKEIHPHPRRSKEQVKAVRSACTKFRKHKKKPHPFSWDLVRVHVKKHYFDYNAVTSKWRFQDAVNWYPSESLDDFLEKAEAKSTYIWQRFCNKAPKGFLSVVCQRMLGRPHIYDRPSCDFSHNAEYSTKSELHFYLYTPPDRARVPFFNENLIVPHIWFSVDPTLEKNAVTKITETEFNRLLEEGTPVWCHTTRMWEWEKQLKENGPEHENYRITNKLG